MKPNNPVFCAIDTTDLAKAHNLAEAIKPHVSGIKVGLEFFLSLGHSGYRQIAAFDVPMFLDLKLHDIPNTVAGAINAVLPLKPAFLTVHTGGGPAMMRAATETAAKAGKTRPKLLGVTVLTSMDTKDLKAVGQEADSKQQVMRLATLAKDCGLDGVVCSPEEIQILREAMGPDFILMVPGIRPIWAGNNDQKRVMTPKEAIAAGATYLVIGRPITAAEKPGESAKLIAAELKA